MAMTPLLIEGWEFSATWSTAHYGHNWAVLSGASVGTSTVRSGAASLTLDNAGVQTVDLGTNQDINVACAFNSPGDLTSVFMRLRDAVSGNIHLTFNRILTTARIQVVGPGGTLGETANNVFPNGVWVHVEVKVHIANSPDGTVQVRVNGVEVLSLTGVDTMNGSNAYVASVELIRSQSFFADDLVVGTGGSSDYFGDAKVVQVLPSAAGNSTQFTPSAGSNYQNVDDPTNTVDADSTYNASSTNGHKDSYNTAALGVTGSVIAVATLAHMRKDDAGSRSARVYTRSGTTNYPSTDISLGNSYQTYQQFMATNPDTSAAWSVAEVDAAEPGVEVRS